MSRPVRRTDIQRGCVPCNAVINDWMTTTYLRCRQAQTQATV
ncbi:hypothetical protein [Lentzea albidocapillata]|nr:hypothetical protein [Lentzea albidocapillata]